MSYKKLRIFYSITAGNVIQNYSSWRKNEDEPSRVAITYISQFFDLCYDLGADAYVISSRNETERKLLCDKQFTVEHRPRLFGKRSGLIYYLRQSLYELQLIATALRFKANLVIVTGGQTLWFIWSILPWLGVSVIPSLHGCLWNENISPSKTKRLILKLIRSFFAKKCTAIIVISNHLEKQVTALTNGQHQPILRALPVYRKELFAAIDDPDEKHSPFQVLFVGRIERHKGVYDLLEIAKRFRSENRQDITFALCGDGSTLDSLQRDAESAGVDSNFVCQGYCNKEKMRQMFIWAHVVIVPTRTNIPEGLNKVVIESILAGRPVVTSKVCPSLYDVREAAVEVSPDDTKGYGDALLRLCDDYEFYEQKRKACLELQNQFYDISRGWGATLKSIILSIQNDDKK